MDNQINELHSRVARTLVASPCHSLVNMEYACALRHLTTVWKNAWTFYSVQSSDIGKNREQICRVMMEKRDGRERFAFDWILMIDTDMVFPDGFTMKPDVLTRLHSWDVPFVAAVATQRKIPPLPCCSVGPDPEHLKAVTHFPEDLCEVDATGISCALIHRDVFEAVEQPWFMPLWNPERRCYSGEDYGFCARVQEAGIKIHVDAGMPLTHLDGSTGYGLAQWNECWETDEATQEEWPRCEARSAKPMAPTARLSPEIIVPSLAAV